MHPKKEVQAIKMRNISKKFKGLINNKGLSEINLEVKQEEVYGLLGNNGCGKSTMIKLITG
jgi:ABC-type sugar transport system ATPase subunit